MNSQQQLYGPNSEQVERFLERLHALTPEQWLELSDNVTYQIDIDELESSAGAEGTSFLEAAAHALNKVELAKGGDYFLGLRPLTALVLIDSLPGHQFALMYAPFQRLIPVEELGPGLAPAFYEQLAAVYAFASDIERGRREVRDPEYLRNSSLAITSVVAGTGGIVATLIAGGWAGIFGFVSVLILLLISLWGQKVEAGWTRGQS